MPLAEAVTDPAPVDLAALAMDRLPLAVVVVDRITRTIRYANAAAKMRGAACDMPVPGAVLDPARIACDQAVPVPLGDGDVPMTATLLPGDAGLLLIEQPAQVAEAAKLLQMIDGMPVAVMTADPQDDFRINYLNRTSREIMRRVEAHLPVEADALLGKSIDVFHAHARHQRALLADPANLPFKTRIKVGNELLSLEATAIMATDGRYLGPMVTWKLVTEEARLSNDVGAMATALASSFEQLNQQAAGLRTRAQTKARVVSELSGAAQHMDNMLNHISRHVAHAGMLASQINEQAGATTRVVQSLEESAEQIERMSTAIGRIATQTNLLALNATIEAARAGDAGRGFGVVASEVKALATETARANADISLQISGMRNATTAAAAAMRAIKVEIGELAEAATEVQRANDQQADSAAAVNRSVAEVRVAAEETDVAADVVSGLANDLSSHAQGLRQKLGSVLG